MRRASILLTVLLLFQTMFSGVLTAAHGELNENNVENENVLEENVDENIENNEVEDTTNDLENNEDNSNENAENALENNNNENDSKENNRDNSIENEGREETEEGTQGESDKDEEIESNDSSNNLFNTSSNHFTIKIDAIKNGPDGEEYTDENPLDPSDPFYLRIDWSLEEGHGFEANHEETVQLPKQITIQQEVFGELKDSTGAGVAEFVVGTDGIVTITFTDYVENHSNISGWFEFSANLDLDNVEEEGGKIKIDQIGEEGALEIPIDRSQIEKSINKQGEVVGEFNAEEIEWTVTLNKASLSYEEVTFKDILPEGTKYVDGSFEVKAYPSTLSGKLTGDAVEVDDVTLTVNDGVLSANLGDIDKVYEITYRTKVTDMDKKTFKNKATFQDENEQDVSADATIEIERHDPLTKGLVDEYDHKNRTIDWYLEFNYNQKTLNDITIEDNWTPKGKVEFVEDSLKFQEVTIGADGTPEIGEEVSLSDLGGQLEVVDDGFKITGLSSEGKAYYITYTTKLKDRELDGFELSNIAGFDGYTTGSGTGIRQMVGTKSATNINYKDQIITWKVQVNLDEHNMNNVVVTDTIGEGLTLIDDSVQVNGTNTSYNLNGNELVVNLGDLTTSAEITYQTKYDPEALPEQGEQLIANNKANIEWTPEGSEDRFNRDVNINVPLNKESFDNARKHATYNPDEKEITWDIYANYRQNAVDLTIIDTPQGNQEIVDGSIDVFYMNINEDGSFKRDEDEAIENVEDKIEVKDGTITIKIGETNRMIGVTYKTSIKGLDKIKKTYKNEAKVQDGETVINELEASVEVYGKTKVGKKTGAQVGKRIDWAVEVNSAQQVIKNLTFKDTIGNDQEYLEDTIKVYEASLKKEDGEFVLEKGDEFTDLELSFDSGEEGKNFTITWNDEIDRPFIIEYSTLYFAGHDETVTNNYKITGDSITEDDKDAASGGSVQIVSAGGGATGTAGYLIVEKTDVTYETSTGQERNKPLKEIEFELIDPETDAVLRKMTTDDDGKADFGRLLLGEYILKEITRDGYVGFGQQKINLTKAYDQNEPDESYTIEVENYEPIYAVEFVKVDSENSNTVLEDAKFEIRDSSGNYVKTATSDSNGRVLFDDLPGAGTYTVKETKRPKDYQLDETEYTVTIGDEEQYPVSLNNGKVKNTLTPGQAQLTKVDAEFDKKLSGAEFTIYERESDETGSKVRTVTSDADGVVNTGDLAPGDYIIKETKAPNGYKISDNAAKGYAFSIELESDRGSADEIVEIVTGNNNEVTNEVKQTKLTLTKRDSVNNDQLIEGAKFEIVGYEGEYEQHFENKVEGETASTNESGVATFEGLKPGTYTIKEIEPENAAEYGYIVDSDKEIKVKVDINDVHNGTTVNKGVENKPLAEVLIQKVDADSNYNLEGATFEIKDANGDVIRTVTTGKDGKVSVTGLPAGSYTLKEITPPNGYRITNDEEIHFQVKADVTETDPIYYVDDGAFKNEIIPGSVKLTKVDAEEKERFLDGVEFTLEATELYNVPEETHDAFLADYNGKLQESYTTDSNGEISISELRPGEYKFTEIATKDGYQLHDWEDFTFTIDVDTEQVEQEVTVENYQLVDVSVEKKWQDTGHERPVSVEVALKQNDEQFKKETLSDTNDWQHTFENLDAVDNDGNAYVYTIEEIDVPTGYTSVSTGDAADGFTITNTRSENINISGKKTWNYGEDGEKYTPDEITVKLMKNNGEVEVRSQTVKADDNGKWTYEFTDLPRFDDKGVEIKYSVEEEEVPGFTPEVDGFNITNTQETITISGEKTWQDEENTADRPVNITVQVLIEGTTTVVMEQTLTVTSDETQSYTFENLPKYDKDGNEITYAINELNVPGYVAEIDGYDITNTRTDKTDISVTKDWLDEDENDRPDSITVQLFQNGTKLKDATIKQVDNWTYTFADLDQFDKKGQPYKYTVEEVNVDEKYAAQEPQWIAEDNGYTITNVRTGTTTIEGTKTWLDDNNPNRPESIELKVSRSVEGEQLEEFKTEIIEKQDGSKWSYSFDYPAFNEEGKAYTYEVEEVVPEGYELKERDGFDFTNVRVGTTEVSGEKTWTLGVGGSTYKPKSILIHLMANDEEEPVKSETVESPWTYEFTDLPKYDENGVKINYSIVEEAIAGFTPEYDEFDITNVQETIEIPVTKVWDEVDLSDRPETITIAVNNGQNVVDSIRLKGEQDELEWFHTFKNLPKYNMNGEEIVYTVEEVEVENYNTKIDQTDEGFVITNTQKTYAIGDFVWIDRNKDGIQDENEEPLEGVTVELYDKDGNKIDETKTDENGRYIFDELPAGEYKVKFTLTEEQAKKYRFTKEQAGEDTKVDSDANPETGWTHDIVLNDDNEFLTKEYDDQEFNATEGIDPTWDAGVVELVQIPVEKVWIDNDNAEESRPDAITVNILANGEPTDVTADLTAEDGWSHLFKGLDKYDENGETIKYIVEEETVEGYEVEIEETKEGFVLTNIRTGEIDVSVEKVWKGEAQESVTIKLLANGEKVDTVELSEENDWSHIFTDLKEFDEEGKRIEYTVDEVALEGYTTTITGNFDEGFTVTNTRTGVTELVIEKVWEDEEADDRPLSIMGDIFQNGEKYSTFRITAEDDWILTVTDLPEFDEDGEPYEYTVVEHEIDGYESEVTETEEGFTITNSYTPDEAGNDIPKTATNMYNFLFLGGAILLLGLIILGYTRRRA